ncbi:MAG: protein translocase subunit SecD [Candidatus Omnitrophica bacterium]|nr:protein translocase subunit SecD [Candidatus Omnitrophota bacterium]
MQRMPVWKIGFIVFTILLSLWMLLPSMEFYSYDALMRNQDEKDRIKEWREEMLADGVAPEEVDAKVKAKNQDFRDLKSDSIRLGLDLQGGVHLVIEVDHEKFEQQLRDDLAKQGKTEQEIEQEVESSLATVLDSAMAVIENRVDSFGVAEVALVKQPPWRIVLEMPGVSEPEEVKSLVNAEAELYFHIVAPKNELGRLLPEIDSVVEGDFIKLVPQVDPYVAAVAVEYPDNYLLVDEIINRSDVKRVIPRQYMFKWGDVQEPTNYINYEHRYLYLLEADFDVSGSYLEPGGTGVRTDAMGRPEIILSFDRDGKRIFSRVTGDHVGEHLAIVLNDQVYSAPVIRDKISYGVATISGIDTYDEAREIAIVLRAGSLPAPLTVAESRVVGPSLGADSIRKGIYSGLIGGVIVLVFMVVYYALVGVVADFAVLLNLFFLMAGMAMFKATLTLPGIAGIVLTIGMAVDANVLIFERLREEMRASKRAKTIQLILDKGYGRAFMTIFDANLTTLITALVLFQFGTGPIKGFAVTLSLGIIISMFTAVFVSRVIMDVMVAKGMKTLSVGTMRFFGETKIDFLKNARILMTTTGCLAIAGFLFLVYDWEKMQGIDFAGGDEVQLQFQQETSVQEVRSAMSEAGYADAVVQRVLGAGNQMMIRVREGEVESPEVLATVLREKLPEKPFNDDFSYNRVGAKVGGELLWKGLYCVIFSSIGILLYITVRFEFRFAVAAVVCLFHDLLFTLAFLAITGTEFNLPIIAALLTVLGYSLNDTIVVFDRIRENYTSALLNFKEIVNLSINQTLTRTINTSATTLIVILMLYLLGGSVIHDFALTLLMGVIIGTYSSIFVASPVLLMLGRQPAPAVAEKNGKRAMAT